MSLSLSSRLKLNSNREIPCLGLGVYLLKDGGETYNAVKYALKAGYRHIDTARVYNNEKDVGRAVNESGIDRAEIFLTTKLWNEDQGYDTALYAFDESLRRLSVDYVDLYLIHWPVSEKRRESWRALEEIYKNGGAKSIGVCNYSIKHLEELKEYAQIIPAVNQVEFSPFLYQTELLDYCRKEGIQIIAHTPLGRGQFLDDKRLFRIGEKYVKTPAQVLIRWALELGLCVIPKSAHRERIQMNSEVFDFSLSEEDMKVLGEMNENFRHSWDPNLID